MLHASGPIKEIANVILFGMMCGAVYIHFALKDGIEKMTPALVFGLLLGCRFIVHLQVKAREARQAREAEAQVETKKEQWLLPQTYFISSCLPLERVL